MPIVNEAQAMAYALLLARRGPTGENPRVGCVVLDAEGAIAGEGWHEGAGSAHAEGVALAAAGDRARGATVVVTLEPCAHRGRTEPCVDALIAAGVTRVVYGSPDPNPIAAGGAIILRTAGIDTVEPTDPVARVEAAALIARWAFAIAHHRPFVTWKLATTLDGRIAARDGSSKWITGPAARADVHRLRAECDTVLVGTGTVRADDPQLTVRDPGGHLAGRQPTRAVMGLRDLPPDARVLDGTAPSTLLRTRDPAAALADLWAAGSRHVLLESGPTLAAAFLTAQLVDEVIAYVAPAVLGAGRHSVGDLGLSSIGDALRFELAEVTNVGGDVRITMRAHPLDA